MRYRFGDYVFDTERRELHQAGEPVKLRRKVFQVLAYLLAHRDRVVSKQELLEHLWPDQFVGEATLTSCIKTLRQALGEQWRTPRFLRTLHGQGYRFVGAVEEQESRQAEDVPPASPQHLAEGATGKAVEPTSALPALVADSESSYREALDGEYKQVTVLCGALAEVSTLAAHLGPEAMHQLMQDLLALAHRTVQRYEGTITQASGEGFLALFGAPVAQEDHARQAVLAALELRQRLHAPGAIRTPSHGVALRMGLHTGPVVVGPLAYEPQRLYTAAGDTLHLAERLQQRATPDAILISAATYALVRDEVQGEACEPLPLNGASASVPTHVIHTLLRRRSGVLRRGAQPLSRFVGRTQELSFLHERLERTLGGQGQALGIAGEPGLGKSRLLAEFSHGLRGRPVTYCEGQCLTYGRAVPYLPVQDLLRQLWGFPDLAPAAAMTTAVHQRLHEAGIRSEGEALMLLQLLDVPVDLTPLAALGPLEQRARTFALLREIVRHASRRRPLILVVENLHWTDPTSEEWLASLVERLGDVPVLLLTTYRPGHQPPWLRHSAATQMALPRLSPHESLVMLQSVPQAARLSVSVQQSIVARAAGNPFFIEELAWAARGHGNSASTLPLPETVEAVLAARLDRLAPQAKRLVQVAAVIGTEVPVPLLRHVSGLPEDALQRGLASLQGEEFLYETHAFPEPAYTFKHALTYEMAYGSLLEERRLDLHARIVEAIEALYPDRLADEVDRLAHHAFRGEMWDKAVTYARQAGVKAGDRFAYREAVTCLEQALEALTHLPEDRDSLAQSIDLRLHLRTALLPLGEFRRLHDLLREAVPLAEALGDRRRLAWVADRLCHASWQMGDYKAALECGQRALAINITLGNLVLQVATHVNLAFAHHALGDYSRAITCCRAAVSLEGVLPPPPASPTGRNDVNARARLSQCLAELGLYEEGITHGEAAIRMAEARDHPFSRASAYGSLGHLYLRQGDLYHAIPILERGVELCQMWQIQFYFPHVASPLGAAYALSGRVAEALLLLEQAVEQAVAMGFTPYISRGLAALSAAYLLAGRSDEALPPAERALAVAREHHEQGDEAWALHLIGQIATQRHPPDVESAEELYRQALALAEALGMRPLQAHCRLGLGTLYARTGRPEQSHAELSAAITLYRAMDMLFWLPQAEAALGQVVWR